MGARKTKLCILCLFCSGIAAVFSASLQASFSPNPAIKGSSRQHLVQCTFTAQSGENIGSIQLLAASGKKIIATLFPSSSKPSWSTERVALALKQRGDVFGSVASGHLRMVLNDTVCGDEGVSYVCQMTYTVGESAPVMEKETTVEIHAGPGVPDPMTASPASSEMVNVTEFSQMTLACSGNVGLPAGNFSWFTTTTGDTEDRHSVTQQADQQAPRLSDDGCTFTRNSSLRLTLPRTEEGQPLQVLCLVDQATLQQAPSVRDCADPSIHFCRHSVPINVLYAVGVRVSSEPVTVPEGGDVTVPCVATGNPRPQLIEWRREGENTTFSTGAGLVLHNVTMNDTGSFVCMASNVILGSTHRASATVMVTVVKVTTPTHTTAGGSTSGQHTTPGGQTSPSKAGLSSDDITIIVVVLVSLVVIVAIIVIVIIMRRRKAQKQLEESPEKGLNNQAEVSAIAMQPESSLTADQLPPNVQPPDDEGGHKNKDGLMYADLQFDNKPRSRRPLAIDDSHTEYADISMPQV
ncbi:hypothetical protein ACOMHN_000669 [Nucella lapillus]